MLEKPAILALAAQAARHATAQHAAHARNIAHVDTPGYRARAVAPFDPSVGALALRRTDPLHLASARPGPASREVVGAHDGTGNTVSLEEQVLGAVDASRAHGRAVTVYRASLDLLRAAIGGR